MEVVLVTRQARRSERTGELIERRLPHQRRLGDRPDRHVDVTGPLERGDDLVEQLRVGAVDDESEDRIPVEHVPSHPDALADLRHVAIVTVHDGEHRRSEMSGETDVDGDLHRRRRTGEVRPLDHHQVAVLLDLLVAGDGVGHADIGTGARRGPRAAIGGVGEGVADPLRRQLVAMPDQLGVVVRFVMNERTEEAELADAPGEQLHQARGSRAISRLPAPSP